MSTRTRPLELGQACECVFQPSVYRELTGALSLLRCSACHLLVTQERPMTFTRYRLARLASRVEALEAAIQELAPSPPASRSPRPRHLRLVE